MDQRQLRTSRRSTLRFIIYAVFIFLVYRLLASFWVNDAEEFKDTYTPPASNNAPHQPDRNENVKDMPAPDFETKEESQPEQELNLPWYPKQTKLSTADRIELELKASKLARDEALEVLSQFNIEGIPGTAVKTHEEAQTIYAKLDCFTQGSWVYNPTPRELLIHLQESLYSKCDKRYERDYKETDTSEWKVRNELKYIWTPLDRSQCPLIPVDKSNWCDVMARRHILLVGDILQFQMHELLLDSFRDGPAVCYGELNCKDHTLCSEPEVRMRYLRNDILSVVRKNPEVPGGHPEMRVVQWPWITSNVIGKYPVLILNRGASYVDDDMFRTQLIDTMRIIRGAQMDHLIIYRSTPIGHPDCDSATAPLEVRPTESELQDLPYHWGDYKRQNLIAKEIVQAAGGVFIDVAQMTDLRPDGHIGGQDCMRYCIPGPLDAWADILYNVFLLLGKPDSSKFT
ncbi:hypothetical protein K450DRAFT_277180 [Umbelopsis ramanniana AG]|uniref:Trichome birefringence-like C-terminal domain-containing protein n=1 Tax=Umbelopsis ramanniana AG TaxID=1314678 RepID=A0AAD5HGL7_UMBRA|nr:uncharacterized protein K450DRAFT_277180 [Umbelopsis ramanniana AG]KAI8583605.1 hypothetical protein K450DRAFT_277180 [Umbelopsis ramanniana AG]